MNDSDRLYASIQQRLLEDKLIGASIRRVRGETALDRIERDFQFWQNDTAWPEACNTYVNNLGKRNG